MRMKALLLCIRVLCIMHNTTATTMHSTTTSSTDSTIGVYQQAKLSRASQLSAVWLIFECYCALVSPQTISTLDALAWMILLRMS